ncbi:radical SAM family heme chaperone HemW [Candidatus Vallotia tarda]|nr:radical SAM family heme chaperone HemW [Candidatus Vallotia tarda]
MLPSYPSPLEENDAQGVIGALSTSSGPRRTRPTTLPPLSLYVHFPWCIRKCPYCDFNSHAFSRTSKDIYFPENFPEIEYINALRADLETALPLIWGRPIHTVFIGGGTPSLLSAQAIDRLLLDLRALLLIDINTEITLEANPETLEATKFTSFRSSGVNRLSIGIQSFNDAHLRALGRTHDAAQCRRAVEIARSSFDNFNLDLMFSLPNQTYAQCYTDIKTVLSFEPPHLSLYQLTLEPNTYFHKYPPALPDHDTSSDMQDWIRAHMHEAGYQCYEVSAYAKKHRYSQHNLNYWQFGDYLGIGAGAHSKLSFPERIVRQMRYKHPVRYLTQIAKGAPIHEQHEISDLDLSFEFMLNALRLTKGFPAHLFVERTGLTMKSIEPALLEAECRGLIWRDQTNIAPTPLGQRFLNDLQALFLKDKI